MSSKIKKFLIGIIIIFVLLVVASLLTAPAENNPASVAPSGSDNAEPSAQPTGSPEPPPAPAFQTTEKRFEVIEANIDGTYRVYDIDAKKDTKLFIPEDANITAGSRGEIEIGTSISVQRYMSVADSIIATELSIASGQ